MALRDYQYLRNTYFFLHEFYRANLPDFRALNEGAQFSPESFVDVNALEVYVNDFNTNNDAETYAKPGAAWVDPSDTLGTAEIQCFNGAGTRLQNSGCFETGTWELLDPDEDYTIVAEAGYLILERPVSEGYALAVRFRTLDPSFDGLFSVKLLVSPRPRAIVCSSNSSKRAMRDPASQLGVWNGKTSIELPRVLALGANLTPETLRVDIVKEVSGQEDQPSQSGSAYIGLMGLDERGQDPGSPPDRIIDADYIGLDDIRGHLIFPDQRPFDPRAPSYRGRINDVIPEVYDSQQQRDQTEASRYKILVRASSSEQRIRLGGVFGGVRPETVEVRLNGRGLTRGDGL